MNIYDVSRQAGVSIATVSRVLNESPGVSDKTRAKVLRVMRQLGYEPNAFARGLGLNSMKTIGLLCVDLADPFLAQAISHLERLLRAQGYSCLLCCTGLDAQAREHDLSLLLSKRVDALIFVGSHFVSMRADENRYIQDAARRVPVMLLNGRLSGENIFCTLCDDEQASFGATDRLIHAGRRHPIYLYHMPSYACERKIAGFRRALAAHGLPCEPESVRQAEPDSVEAQLTELMEAKTPFDGLLTSGDELGASALKAASRLGLKVPEALAIVGYNNSALCRWCEPELSSIDNQLDHLCEHTVNSLMAVLGGQSQPNAMIFAAELLERGTTPPLS